MGQECSKTAAVREGGEEIPFDDLCIVLAAEVRRFSEALRTLVPHVHRQGSCGTSVATAAVFQQAWRSQRWILEQPEAKLHAEASDDLRAAVAQLTDLLTSSVDGTVDCATLVDELEAAAAAADGVCAAATGGCELWQQLLDARFVWQLCEPCDAGLAARSLAAFGEPVRMLRRASVELVSRAAVEGGTPLYAAVVERLEPGDETGRLRVAAAMAVLEAMATHLQPVALEGPTAPEAFREALRGRAPSGGAALTDVTAVAETFVVPCYEWVHGTRDSEGNVLRRGAGPGPFADVLEEEVQSAVTAALPRKDQLLLRAKVASCCRDAVHCLGPYTPLRRVAALHSVTDASHHAACVVHVAVDVSSSMQKSIEPGRRHIDVAIAGVRRLEDVLQPVADAGVKIDMHLIKFGTKVVQGGSGPLGAPGSVPPSGVLSQIDGFDGKTYYMAGLRAICDAIRPCAATTQHHVVWITDGPPEDAELVPATIADPLEAAVYGPARELFRELGDRVGNVEVMFVSARGKFELEPVSELFALSFGGTRSRLNCVADAESRFENFARAVIDDIAAA